MWLQPNAAEREHGKAGAWDGAMRRTGLRIGGVPLTFSPDETETLDAAILFQHTDWG